jgi:FlaA1/EpsC-like NDP-sugar epimerase
MNLDGTSILLTGGTGSFGREFTRRVLRRHKPERLVIFSRDELKQFQMRQEFPVDRHPEIRMTIGDVRDRNRLLRVMDGIDVVVHAAALKQGGQRH